MPSVICGVVAFPSWTCPIHWWSGLPQDLAIHHISSLDVSTSSSVDSKACSQSALHSPSFRLVRGFESFFCYCRMSASRPSSNGMLPRQTRNEGLRFDTCDDMRSRCISPMFVFYGLMTGTSTDGRESRMTFIQHPSCSLLRKFLVLYRISASRRSIVAWCSCKASGRGSSILILVAICGSIVIPPLPIFQTLIAGASTGGSILDGISRKNPSLVVTPTNQLASCILIDLDPGLTRAASLWEISWTDHREGYGLDWDFGWK